MLLDRCPFNLLAGLVPLVVVAERSPIQDDVLRFLQQRTRKLGGPRSPPPFIERPERTEDQLFFFSPLLAQTFFYYYTPQNEGESTGQD